MSEQHEWEFRFFLQSMGDAELNEEEARAVLEAAITFAEQRNRGIGGGYRYDRGGYEFAFGFCVTVEGAVIHESEAAELLAHISETARRAGQSITEPSVAPFELGDDPKTSLAELMRKAEDLARRIN